MKFPTSSFARGGALAGAAFLLLCSQAHAATDCPLLSEGEVAAAFNDRGARQKSADSNGVCVWELADGATLSTAFYKEPDVAETREAYEAWKDAYAKDYTRAMATPAIGKSAYFGIRAAGGHRGEASLLAMQDSSILILSYAARPQEEAPDKVAAPMLALGKQAIARIGKVDQSFGKCEWFTDAEIRSFLGKGALKIHRSGPNSCSAWNRDTKASLAIEISDEVIDEKHGRAEPESDFCTMVKLPQFGRYAYVEYACRTPMNHLVRIEFYKNDKNVSLSFTAAGRDANEADAKPLTDIAQRAFERF